jgi:signal transduction histidine kinase
MGILRRPLSVRTAVVLQLTLVAIASLSLLSVFALKVIELTLERRYREAGVSVGEVVRRALERDAESGRPLDLSRAGLAGAPPYVEAISLLPEGPPDGAPVVSPAAERAVSFLPVYPTVDVTLPLRLSDPALARAGDAPPRGIRVRLHSPGISEEVRTLVNVTLALAVLDVAVLVLFGGFLLERTVVGPVRRLASVSEKIAGGEYGLRAEVSEGNELGQLATSFNRMVDGILAAQERLRRSEQDAFRSEKLATVGRLAAGVAHEVGNPLMAIRGYAEHLTRNRPSREEAEECLGKIVAETKRMENIVRGLLSVASPGEEREGATDVDAAVRGAVEMLSYRNLFREVEVRLACEGAGMAAIPEDRFRQVLLNLLINAVDAMGGKGTLTVRTQRIGEWSPRRATGPRRRASDPPETDWTTRRMQPGAGVRAVALSVADTGPGIPGADLPLLFDPFYTTKEPGKGTGLGLSVSRTIVEGAGGEIWAESEEGKGATFHVIIPAAGERTAT